MWFFVSSLPFILLVPVFLLPVPLLSCLCSHPFHPPFSPLLLIHHPTCPEFPPPAFISPLLPLCSLFLPTCFIFYCTCFLSSSLVPVAPLFPSLSLSFRPSPSFQEKKKGPGLRELLEVLPVGLEDPRVLCVLLFSPHIFLHHFISSSQSLLSSVSP